MAVTPEDVRRVAELAALRVEPDDADGLAEELNGILDHFASLEEVDVSGVPPFAAGGRAPLRPDEPGADPLARGPDAGAPAWADGMFTVPRLASHATHDDGPLPAPDTDPAP